MAHRRIAAVVAPVLACEVVRQREEIAGPLAVIVDFAGVSTAKEAGSFCREAPVTEPLDVVDEAARRFGVRPGQRAAEACALASRLAVRRITAVEIAAALGALAEMTMTLGTTAAIEAMDTVWVDVTGAAHLVGGEEVLVDELAERAGALGHRVRVAIADGPRIAQAVARFAKEPCTVVPVGKGAQALAPLPVHALPIDDGVASFLVRVGVFSIGDLAKLPRAAVAARLASDRGSKASVGANGASKPERVREALDLAQGRDPTPLVPWEAPRCLEEIVCFDEPTPSSEALLFALRGMCGRLAARLAARGEATGRVDVSVALDRSIAALQRVEPSVELGVDLPAPLCTVDDLLRSLKWKVERIELAAPAVALRLVASEIVRARRMQLDLSRRRTASPDALPALLAELSADIGADRLGVLRIVNAHRPEARSVLEPSEHGFRRLEPSAQAGVGDPVASSDPAGPEPPTRLLATPAPLGPVAPGAVVVVGTQLYTVERMRFVQRLDDVEWWTTHPARRDYFRAWLTAPCAKIEAWIYIDRRAGDAFLHGFCE